MAEVGSTAYWRGERVVPDVTLGKAHALLGDVVFDLITYFDGSDYKFGADYTEHARIGAKPRLQWVGDKLATLTWRMSFHHVFCEPEKEILKLRAAVAKRQAMPLVLANGDYKGWFIPTEVSVTAMQTAIDGTLLVVEAEMSLIEHVPPPVPVESPAQQAPQAAVKSANKKPARSVKKKAAPRKITVNPTR